MESDIVNSAVRRRMMQAVQRDGTDIEVAVRRVVRLLGHRYRLNRRNLPGSPDLSNEKARWAIFVHGCFWHGHPHCAKTKGGRRGRIPVANRGFWERKIASNRLRDASKAKSLSELGFRVLTIWECEVQNSEHLQSKIGTFIRSAAQQKRQIGTST